MVNASATEGCLISDRKRRIRVPHQAQDVFYIPAFVVVPIQQRISPRAKAGFNIFAASIQPEVEPAPTRVWISSIKRMAFLSNFTSSTSCFKRGFQFTPPAHGAGNHQCQINGVEALTIKDVWHLARGKAMGQSFNNGGFTCARFSEKNRIVSGTAAQDFKQLLGLVASDNRIKFFDLFWRG